jgi:hypothetical protein
MTYLGYSADDLDCNLLTSLDINRSHHLSKGTLSEKGDQGVLFAEFAILFHNVVTIIIINFLGWLGPL